MNDANNPPNLPVAVSACLLGLPCRYDGGQRPVPAVWEVLAQRTVVPICPEVAAGMPVPRVSIEFARAAVADVIASRTGLVNAFGEDVTAQMVGTCAALCDRLRGLGVREAWLKEGSPSCGVHRITVGGGRTAGEGIQTALLRQAGVHVRSEEDLPGFAPSPADPGAQGGGT